MHVAKDFFLLGGVLRVDMDTDFGLEVRGPFGAAAHELAVWPLAQMTPLDVEEGHPIFVKPDQGANMLALPGRDFVFRNVRDTKQDALRARRRARFAAPHPH